MFAFERQSSVCDCGADSFLEMASTAFCHVSPCVDRSLVAERSHPAGLYLSHYLRATATRVCRFRTRGLHLPCENSSLGLCRPRFGSQPTVDGTKIGALTGRRRATDGSSADGGRTAKRCVSTRWSEDAGETTAFRLSLRGSPIFCLFVTASYLVDLASSHMLVSKIKPCMSKYRP